MYGFSYEMTEIIYNSRLRMRGNHQEETKDGFTNRQIRVINKQIGQDSSNILGSIRKHR